MRKETKRQAIADELRRRINSGTYEKGGPLPAQRELMDEFDAARETVRDALAQLVHEGLITQGQGAVAKVRENDGIYLSSETDAVTWSERVGPGSSDDIVEAVRELASGLVAERLGVPDGTEVLRLVRHQRNGTLIAVVTQWIPADVADAVKEATGNDLTVRVGDLWEWMKQAGHTPTSTTETTMARTSAEDHQRIFGIPPTVPILVTVRVTVTDEGRPVEYSVADQRGDMAVMVYVNRINR